MQCGLRHLSPAGRGRIPSEAQRSEGIRVRGNVSALSRFSNPLTPTLSPLVPVGETESRRDLDFVSAKTEIQRVKLGNTITIMNGKIRACFGQ
jgi:hypothetical protein